jgi:hypothetical protein
MKIAVTTKQIKRDSLYVIMGPPLCTYYPKIVTNYLNAHI